MSGTTGAAISIHVRRDLPGKSDERGAPRADDRSNGHDSSPVTATHRMDRDLLARTEDAND